MLIPTQLRLDELFFQNGLPDASLWLRDGAVEVLSRVAAIRAPIEQADSDVPGCLPPLALRIARQLELRNVTATRTAVALHGVGRIERPRPRLKADHFDALAETLLPGDPVGVFGVDPALLARLATAMGANHGVIVAWRAAEGALHVRPREPWLTPEAIVMPMRLDWFHSVDAAHA